MKKIFALLAMALMAATAVAQEYRYEVGPALGVSGYIGDISSGNMYKHPGIVGGGVFRYNMNSRIAFKGNLLYASISGNSNDCASKFPDGEHYEFKSHLVDLGAQAEFNFLNYGVGAKYKNYSRISPYMVLGVGATAAFVDGTHFTFNIPMGVGVKYKVKERLNLGFEFTMRKAFGDRLDGLSDLYRIQHGFAKNTDWYSVAMFTITYEFSKRCSKCHYVE